MSGSAGRSWRLPALLGSVGFLMVLLPGLLGPYGPFIDELYYVSCAKRLAWGYVDHPPLAPFVLRVTMELLGDSLLAVRLPAALTAGLVVGGIALLARRLGAGTYGQILAAGAALSAPLLTIMLSFFSMNALEIGLWTACLWLLVEIEIRDEPRLWLAFGVVAGVGLVNKHTMVILAAGLAVGLVATPARRHLRQRWIWIGAGLAAAILLPNVLWQAAHGWPSLDFYRNADLYKNVPTPPHVVLFQQALFMSPGTLPVWIAGIVLLLRRRDETDLRPLGVIAVSLLALLAMSQKSRPDRIVGMYPLLLAAGGALLERVTATSRRRHAWRAGLAAWLVAWGALLAPLGYPILPPASLARYAGALGLVPQIESGTGKRPQVPQWFADRLGWPQLVDDVAAARQRLRPEERERAAYFAPSYGQAGALDWLGAARGLAPVYATHNNWYLWGPPERPIDVAIVLGNDPERLAELFEHVELAGIHDCDYCMPWRDQMPIWIVRRERGPIAAHWADWKHFE